MADLFDADYKGFALLEMQVGDSNGTLLPGPAMNLETAVTEAGRMAKSGRCAVVIPSNL